MLSSQDDAYIRVLSKAANRASRKKERLSKIDHGTCRIVERSGHGVPKVVKAYGREAFRFLGFGIMVTIPFDKKVLM